MVLLVSSTPSLCVDCSIWRVWLLCTMGQQLYNLFWVQLNNGLLAKSVNWVFSVGLRGQRYRHIGIEARHSPGRRQTPNRIPTSKPHRRVSFRYETVFKNSECLRVRNQSLASGERLPRIRCIHPRIKDLKSSIQSTTSTADLTRKPINTIIPTALQTQTQ